MKSQVLHTVLCNISDEAAGEIWKLIKLGSVSHCRRGDTADRMHSPRYFSGLRR